MQKLVYHTANASGRLDKNLPIIKEAIRLAEQYAVSKLKIREPIDIIFTDGMPNIIIPELHLGGHTYWSDFIVMSVDSEEKVVLTDLFLMLCHELCHAVRWQYNSEFMNTLYDGAINEGLATAFEIEAAKDNNMELDFFAKTIAETPNEECERVLDILRPELNSKYYDYNRIFFNGDSKLPRWSGYLVGHYLVKKYLMKTNKKVSEVFAEKYLKFTEE